MNHPDKNRLLEYFYGDGTELEFKRTHNHIKNCLECMAYMTEMERVSRLLNRLPDQTPSRIDLGLITGDQAMVSEKTAGSRRIAPVVPYLKIALTIPVIMAVLYLVHDRIILLPFWGMLENIWIIQKIGSFGLAAAAFFLFGSFVTMAMAPVLLLNTEKLKEDW